MNQNEIIVTTISNPFSGDKDVKQVPCTGEPVSNYLPITDEKITVTHNGHVVPDEQLAELCPQPGDSLIIRPVITGGGNDNAGKAMLDIVATVALLTVLPAAAAAWATSTFGGALIGSTAYSFWGYAAYAATFGLGCLAKNQLFPPAKDPKTDPNYSWGGLQPMQGQGNPIQITYGSVRTAGQIITQHIITKDDKSCLNVLLCGGEGEIDSIEGIQINGIPIENFPGVSWDARMGTNDQPILSGFDNTYADQFFNLKLDVNHAWQTSTTKGNNGRGLEITVNFPQGLYSKVDAHGRSGFTIHAQYRPYLPSNGLEDNWMEWGSWYLEENQQKAFSKAYQLDNLPVDQYDVRVQCSYASGSDDDDVRDAYWTCLSHIVYDDFCRPGKVLLGIQALANDQLSGGMPQITWVQTRKYVWVWDPTPEVNQYVQRDADNPAWACYDLIHRCKRLMNIHTKEYEFIHEGVDISRIDYQAFSTWADFCNYKIVEGSDEKRCMVDIILDTAQNLWDALCPIEAVGRGKVIIKGTKYSCICDKPSDPVQLFNVSNIGIDSFTETFMGSKDYANALEVTFTNRDKDFQRDIAFVAANGYDDSPIMQKPTQVTLNGITRYRQAYREAKYRLNLNRYLTRTVSFSADVDAIACTVGDVILVQHDVPQCGIGGRLVSATVNTVTLDKPVTLEADKTYQMMIRLSTTDELVTRTVSGVSEDGKTLTIADQFVAIPQPDDLFSFGEVDKVAKPFRVMNITRDGDLRRKITALEYMDAVYTEATDIPVIDYSRERADFIEVTDLSAQEETFRQKDGTMVSQIKCKWYLPRRRADGFVVYYSSDDGKTWTYCTTATIPEAIIPNVRTGETYLVKICTMRSPVVSLGEISDHVYIYGKDRPPSDVPKLSIVQIGQNLKAIIVPSDDPDIRGYDLRMGSSWSNSIRIPGEFIGDAMTFEAPQEGSLTFWIKAIDNSGGQSQNPTKGTVSVFGLIPKNIIRSESPPTSTWQASGMYLTPTGIWKIKSREKINDYAHLADIFGSAPLHVVDAPYIILPEVDLGDNILEGDCFYIDPWRNIHLKSIEKIGDYAHFADIFNSAPLHLVTPKYATETFLGITIDWNENHIVTLGKEYRVRVDGDGWSDWVTYLEKRFFGRRVQVRLTPQSLDGVTNVEIKGAKIVIDVPDVEDVIENVPIPATKTQIFYHRKFYDTPKSIALFTSDDRSETISNKTVRQVIWRKSDVTRVSFWLELLDDQGNLIPGKLEKAVIRGF